MYIYKTARNAKLYFFKQKTRKYLGRYFMTNVHV